MVAQSLENLEYLEKSGNKICVREKLENLKELMNFTERVQNIIYKHFIINYHKKQSFSD